MSEQIWVTNMMKRKTSCIISGSAAICLLTAVFLAERFSHPPDALAVSVRTADMRNLPQVTEISAETQKTAAAETTAISEEKAPVRDLNLADAADLMRVDGIGETLAADITAYRAELGGFTRRSQLEEISGIGAALAERIMQEFEIVGELPEETTAPPVTDAEPVTAAETVTETETQTETAPPAPKDLNEIGRAELMELPGMTGEFADEILTFRENAGRIAGLYELSILDGITLEWIDRTLAPYVYVADDIYAQDILESAAG